MLENSCGKFSSLESLEGTSDSEWKGYPGTVYSFLFIRLEFLNVNINKYK